jgi:biofilm protein TabA
MIIDTLAAAARYAALNPGFAAGFDFLRRADLRDIAPGRHEILGQRVLAIVERTTGRGHAGARLEVHRKYIDIQISLDGHEQIGWRPLADCHTVSEPYDAERDVGFFADRPAVWTPLALGQFMIFFPADAHAPLAGVGPLHKVVIKILEE